MSTKTAPVNPVLAEQATLLYKVAFPQPSFPDLAKLRAVAGDDVAKLVEEASCLLQDAYRLLHKRCYLSQDTNTDVKSVPQCQTTPHASPEKTTSGLKINYSVSSKPILPNPGFGTEQLPYLFK